MISIKYLIRRTINAFVTYVVALILIFAIPRLIPGNPQDVMASSYRLPGEVANELSRRFGLDQPMSIQFYKYITNVVLKFPPDFGFSYIYYPLPVWDVVITYLPWTIFLLAFSAVLTAALGLVLGVLSAWKRGSKIETLISSVSMFFLSTPYFWIAMNLIMIFGVYLPIFPVAGAFSSDVYETPFSIEYICDVLMHAILPALSLVMSSFARYTLIMRDNMVSTLSEDYILTARAKGVKERTIIFRHAARNAMLPVLTLFILQLGTILGGAIVTEAVFSYPGVGSLLFNSILNQDYPVIQGFFYIITLTVIIANYIADLLYVFVDPRVRY